MTRVMFVCLGNICRSPLAEGLLRHHAGARGLSLHIESSGTSAYHVGEPPDPGSVRVAREHGVDISAQRAQQLTRAHLDTFDVVVAMSESNRRDAQRLRPGADIWLMRDYDPGFEGRDVPDPWSRGAAAFDEVYDILDRATQNLLDHIPT